MGISPHPDGVPPSGCDAAHRIEAAESSASGEPMDWTFLGTVTLSSPVTQWYDPQPATRRKRFYRALKVP